MKKAEAESEEVVFPGIETEPALIGGMIVTERRKLTPPKVNVDWERILARSLCETWELLSAVLGPTPQGLAV